MCGCVEEILIEGVIPRMPRGSLILMSCHPPRFLGCLFISISKRSQNSRYIYIYKKVRKGLDEK